MRPSLEGRGPRSGEGIQQTGNPEGSLPPGEGGICEANDG